MSARGQRWWTLGLAILIALQAGLAIDWLARDQRPAFWDPSAHSRETIKSRHALTRSAPPLRARLVPEVLRDPVARHPMAARWVAGPVAGFANIAEAFYRHASYPSLSYFAGGVLTAALGTSPDAHAFALGTFWYLLSIVGTYLLGAQLRDPATGLLAAVLVSCQPMQLALAREAMVDSAMVAATAWGFFALARCRGFRDRRASLALGIGCGLGMLAKQPFVVVMGLPILWLAARLWFERRTNPAQTTGRVANAGAALLAALLVAGPWYAAYLPAMLMDPIRLGRVAVEVDPGSLSFSLGNLGWYPQALWSRGLGPLLAVPALCGLGYFALSRRAPGRTAIGLGLLTAFVFFTLVFPTKHVRYVAQLGPLFAVVTAVWVSGLPSRSARVAGSSLLVALSAVTLWGTTLRTTGEPHALFRSDLIHAPDQRDWGEAKILAALARHRGEPPEGSVRLLVLQQGIDYWSPLMVRTLPELLVFREGQRDDAIEVVKHLGKIPETEPFYFAVALQQPLGAHPSYIVWMDERDRGLVAARGRFERLAVLSLPDDVTAELYFHPGKQQGLPEPAPRATPGATLRRDR